MIMIRKQNEKKNKFEEQRNIFKRKEEVTNF